MIEKVKRRKFHNYANSKNTSADENFHEILDLLKGLCNGRKRFLYKKNKKIYLDTALFFKSLVRIVIEKMKVETFKKS